MSDMKRWSSAILAAGCMIFLGAMNGDRQVSSTNPQELFARYGSTQGSTEAFFGRSIAGVGDQNGDGYADVLIASNLEKKVSLYLGGSPMDTLPARVYQKGDSGFASAVANLGDVNNDGKVEFAIASGSGIYIYRGASTDTVPMLVLHGSYTHVTGAGDVNGDGFTDVLVSYPYWNSTRGKAWLFFGGNPMDTIPDWVVPGDSARLWFGYAIAGNGDLNHDGFGDFAITEFKAEAAEAPPRIKIYLGGGHPDTLPRLILDGETIHGLGSSAWMVRDINGDGRDELATPSLADTGAFVFFGRDTLKSTPDLILQGSGFSAPMNLRLASVGDVNGDGFNDILTGNQSAVNGLGEVLLYLGGAHMTGKADFMSRGYYGAWEGAGQEVAWCGDVNRDGYNDLMFSCYAPSFLTQNGKVEIFAGSHDLVVSVANRNLSAAAPIDITLEPNYPNPFNASTRIRYALPEAGNVAFEVFDVLGRTVATFSDQLQRAGHHDVTWNAGSLASGIYYIRMTVSDLSNRAIGRKVVKCVLAK